MTRAMTKETKYYAGNPAKEKIIDLFELEEINEVYDKFCEVYFKQEREGLQETAITPAMYNQFILGLFQNYIWANAGVSCTIKENRIVFSDEVQAIAAMQYYITGPYDGLFETLQEVIIHLTESEELLTELEGFIWLNSYYEEY